MADRPSGRSGREGLPAERTALAWQRTGLGLVAVGALMLHVGRAPAAPMSLAGWLLLAVGSMTVLLAPARYRRVLADVRAGHSPLRPAWPRVASAVIVMAALVAVLAA